jgi:hypothetical protein
MNSLEHLVELIESQSPTQISVFAPVLNPTFLWKLSKQISLYRRKNLEEIKIFVLKFTEGASINFLVAECVELQELFPQIKIFFVKSCSIPHRIKMAPGVIFMSNGNQKAFSFETEFSALGFAKHGVISSISSSKAIGYLDELQGEVLLPIDRANSENLLKSLEKKPEVFESKTVEEKAAFDLSFISATVKKIHNAGAGLNWGQPTSSRPRKDLNAAYIHVPRAIQMSTKIPGPGVIFSCKFDDGVEFEMVRTGDGGKNLTSAHENQILGRYIRHRLGVAPGGLIQDAVLERKNYFGLSFYPKGLDEFFVQFNDSKISKSI